MTNIMDLQHNGRLDWFFNEWVYGTQVPRYHFDYQLTSAEGGKTNLHWSITQSEVDEHFVMLVPGSTTHSGDTLLPAQPKKVAFNAYKDILER